MAAGPIRAVSYNRVSTEEEKQLNALAKQIQENRSIIGKNGWEFVREYIDEGKSGTQTKKRDGYNRLFADLEKDDFDIIVIKDQDRLMRNPKDWYLFVDKLMRNKKRLYIHLDGSFYNPDNGLITGIKAILAEEYSRHLSRKINNAHKNRQESGDTVIITNRTWGYRKVAGTGGIVVDEKERKMIEQIFTMYEKGMGSRLICRELSDRGIKNRNGNPLAESQIRAIVRNPLYKGTAVMNKTHINFDTKTKEKVPEEKWLYHENAVPPIVSERLWNAANLALDSHRSRTDGKTAGRKKGLSLLSGKVLCGECGKPFWRNRRNLQRKDGSRTKAVYWYCSSYYRYGRKKEVYSESNCDSDCNSNSNSNCNSNSDCNCGSIGCNSLRLKEEEIYGVLAKIGNAVLDKSKKKELSERVLDKIFAILNTDDSAQQLEKLKDEKKQLLKRKDKLLELLLDGILNREDYQRHMRECEDRLSALEVTEERIKETTGGKEGADTGKQGAAALLEEKETYDIAVPYIISHLEKIKVFETYMEIYLDFEKLRRPVLVEEGPSWKINFQFVQAGG